MESITDFISRFEKAILKCKEKYDRRERLYQASWKSCNISYLEERLLEEAAEFIQERDDDTLVDIVNFALMILQRRAE